MNHSSRTAWLFFLSLIVLGGGANGFSQDTPGYNNTIPESIRTPDHVESPIGDLNFFDGLPDEATVQKLYDNLIFMRGVEAFLNGIPATSIEAIRLGCVEVGAKRASDVVIFDKLMDSNPLFLTGNTDTVYASAILELDRDGPTVVVIPPKCGPGTVDDAWQRFVVDMGAPGLDRGKGAKYLILPPDYKGDLDPTVGGEFAEMDGEKYIVAKSPTYVNWLVLRGFLVDGKPDTANAMFKNGLKIYPLKDKKNPPEMKFISGSEVPFNTVHANDFQFYQELITSKLHRLFEAFQRVLVLTDRVEMLRKMPPVGDLSLIRFWDRPVLLVASAGDEEDQSLKEFIRVGLDELTGSPQLWVAAACQGISVTEEHQRWWEKAIAGLCDLRVVALERLASYVVKTRELIGDEGLPIGIALGRAMPALHFPKDSTFIDRINDNRRTHKSVWQREYNRVYRKNACFLRKQTTSQILLSEEDLAKSFDKVRADIKEELHPVIEGFITAASGWNQEAESLSDCEWEEVRPLFDGLRRVTLNLGEATIVFYDERSPDLLSEEDNDYLELLSKRPKATDPNEDDQAFYESHRNEIKEDRKLRSAWDKFIYGRPRECFDFVVGLAASIESLFNQAGEAKKRTLLIRCDSATKRELRDLNISAGAFFARRYAGLKALLGKKVKWDVGRLFDFPVLINEWSNEKKTRLIGYFS